MFKGVEFNFGQFLLWVLMFLNNFLLVPRDGLVLVWVFKPSKIVIKLEPRVSMSDAQDD